jgi:hypothetical protein
MHGWRLRGKKMLRFFLETPPGFFVRRGVVARESRVEEKFVRTQAESVGVHVFEPQEFGGKLKDKPSADTFFILGSGASINALTPGNFGEIARHRSVGVNNWPVHEFVPDIYSFDSVPWVGDGHNFRRSLDLLHREDIVRARPLVLVVRLRDPQAIEVLGTLPPELRERVHFYGRTLPATRKAKNLNSDVRDLIARVLPRTKGIVLDSGASIVRLIGIGLSLGYKKIVLAGVDLNDTRYFWENNPSYSAESLVNTPINNQNGATHETTSTWIRPFSVVDMVRALANAVSEDFNGQISVVSPKSELASFLPVYSWPDSNRAG